MAGSLADGNEFHFPLGTIVFTGWKASPSSPGSVAQILWWPDGSSNQGTPENVVCYYVNLPGMQVGRYKRGEMFDIGTHRVTDQSEDLIRRMCTDGLKKLIEFVVNDNPPWLAGRMLKR